MRFQYTGQFFLSELGLQYSKSRLYSPTLGRFLQTDPIGYGDGLNWYNYVGGDPVNATDPTGLMEIICTWVNTAPPSYTDSDGDIIITAPNYTQRCENVGSGGSGIGFLNSLIGGGTWIGQIDYQALWNKAICPVLKWALGDDGRLRLGADGAAGLGAFLKVGAGVSLRGDGSVEFDTYHGLGAGVGITGGAGVSGNAAGTSVRSGNIDSRLEGTVTGGYGVGSGTLTVPFKTSPQFNLDTPQAQLGAGIGPRWGLAIGGSVTTNYTYRTQSNCPKN